MSCRDDNFYGPDSAAKSTQQQSLQPVLRLRPTCAGITFEGRVAFLMKFIPLTKGKFATVDDEYFDWLSQWKWQSVEKKNATTPSTWYARRGATIGPGKVKTEYMHRAIAIRHGLPPESDYDHRDGNGLNNQRENIRQCSQTQNNGNRSKEGNCASRYKGVSWSVSRRRWVVRLRKNGKSYGVKRFKVEEEAARHYDMLALTHFGEFAKLNFQ